MSSHSFNYLEKLIAENSYLRMSGVMQVNRQVEIYLKRNQQNYPNTQAIAIQFLSESLQIYQELDLSEKAVEVEQLIPSSMRC